MGKVTEYVERLAVASHVADATDAAMRHSFVVVETVSGYLIVLEKLHDASAIWMVNPQNLQDRLSLAKVIRSASCSAKGTTVADLRRFHQECGQGADSRSARKEYARGAFSRACGETAMAKSGFMVQPFRKKWIVAGGCAKAEQQRQKQRQQEERRAERLASKNQYEDLGQAMRLLMGANSTGGSAATEKSAGAGGIFGVRSSALG